MYSVIRITLSKNCRAHRPGNPYSIHVTILSSLRSIKKLSRVERRILSGTSDTVIEDVAA